MRADSVLMLDRANPVLSRFIVWPPISTGDFEVTVAPHPRDAQRLVGLIHAESETAVTAAMEVMPSLWRFTRVVLKEGKVIEKSVTDSPRGIRKQFANTNSADFADSEPVRNRPRRSRLGKRK